MAILNSVSSTDPKLLFRKVPAAKVYNEASKVGTTSFAKLKIRLVFLLLTLKIFHAIF